MERKKIKIWLPVLVSLAMVAGMYLGYKMRDSMPARSFFYTERRRPIQELLDLVQAKYVDNVNVQDLADTAIAAILAKLDPHSQYIPARSVERANEDIAGSFYGIGIEFNVIEDTLNVVNVIKDGPAFKAGLLVGDKFIKAGDSVIAGRKMDTDHLRQILKGNRGSDLPLDIVRADKRLSLTVSRDFVPVTSVDAAYLIDRTTGFIRLNRFSQHTYREFMQSLEKLKKGGMTRLVLDLRGNGGGVLDEAVEIADEFLEGDRLITYTEGKHFPKKEYRSRRQGQFEEGQLIVLADESTASASEVLIGALQDWDRATVIGRPTFGKGLVQEQYDLSDNSAVRLTISRYYTPLGRSIQRSYTGGNKSYYQSAAKRYAANDSLLADSLKPLGKRVATRNGKILFSGGGITPDYFISHDTSRFSSTTASIISKGLVNRFGYKYFVDHRDQLQKFSSPAEFARNFIVDEQAWNYFVKLVMQDSIVIPTITVAEKYFLTKNLKLAIARQIWRDEGYFIVFNKEDQAVMKALELLK